MDKDMAPGCALILVDKAYTPYAAIYMYVGLS
jgi:hypothetical protein